MPASKDYTQSKAFGRSSSTNQLSMSARVYHPATNLLPPTPPVSPTGLGPCFAPNTKSSSTNSWSRQNSQNGGKYS